MSYLLGEDFSKNMEICQGGNIFFLTLGLGILSYRVMTDLTDLTDSLEQPYHYSDCRSDWQVGGSFRDSKFISGESFSEIIYCASCDKHYIKESKESNEMRYFCFICGKLLVKKSNGI